MYNPKDHAKGILEIWTMPVAGENTSPLAFSDALAELFFYSTLCSALEYAYRCGIRAEQKRRKKKAVQKWRERNVD